MSVFESDLFPGIISAAKSLFQCRQSALFCYSLPASFRDRAKFPLNTLPLQGFGFSHLDIGAQTRLR